MKLEPWDSRRVSCPHCKARRGEECRPVSSKKYKRCPTCGHKPSPPGYSHRARRDKLKALNKRHGVKRPAGRWVSSASIRLVTKKGE